MPKIIGAGRIFSLIPRSRQSSNRRQRRLNLERLESRLALALAHLHHDVVPNAELTIVGSDSADRIELKFEPQSDALIAIRNQEVIGSWSVHDWSAVRIFAQGDDDQIYIDPQLPVLVDIDGGDGNDTVYGIQLGPAQDTLLTSGQPMSFNNRYCSGVECLRVADGESDSANSIVSSSATNNAIGSAATALNFTGSSTSLLNATTISASDHDHQSMLGAAGASASAMTSHSHESTTTTVTTVPSVHHTTQLEMADVGSKRTNRVDMGVSDIGSPKVKACFVQSTTFEPRLDNGNVLVREIVPLKPGCQ